MDEEHPPPEGNLPPKADSQPRHWVRRVYKLYVLLVMMTLYLINMMDRFVLGIGSQRISHDLQFGEMSCHSNASSSNGTCQNECSTLRNKTT